MSGSVCGVLTVLFLLALNFLAWQSEKERLLEAERGWSDFARRHELQGQGLGLRGAYRYYALVLDTERRSMGRRTVTLARLVLGVPSLPPGVVLKPGGFFDLETVRQVRATPEVEAMLQHLPVRERFSAAANAYHALVVEDGLIRAQRVGVPKTLEELEAFIEPALQLARAFDEAARSLQAGAARAPTQ